MLATRTKIQRKQTAVVFGCVFWRLTQKRQTQDNTLSIWMVWHFLLACNSQPIHKPLLVSLTASCWCFLINGGQNAYIVFTEKSQATIQMPVCIYCIVIITYLLVHLYTRPCLHINCVNLLGAKFNGSS